MTTWRIWPSTSGPAITSDANTTDLGTELYVTQSGCTIKGFFWWLPAAGDATAASYSFELFSTTTGTSGTAVSGTLVTSGFTLTAGQWNLISLSAAVALTASTRYRAVAHYSGAANHYGSTANYFSSGGGASDIVNGPLTCPNATHALNSSQGSFNEPSAGSIAFPTSVFSASNYWIDVLIDDGLSPAPAGPGVAVRARLPQQAGSQQIYQPGLIYASSVRQV